MEKPTGSVRKETIAVSGTIRKSVQNQRHSQLLLQNLRSSRMEKFQRDQKVREAEVRMSRRNLRRFYGRLENLEANPMCSIQSRTASRQHSRSKAILWNNLPRGPSSGVAPTSQTLRIGLRKRQSGKSDVPVKQRGGWLKASLK